MKKTFRSLVSALFILTSAALLSACGKNSASGGGLTIQSAPLAGPNAASVGTGFPHLAFRLFESLFGETLAHAAVSAFTSFKACNDTLIFLDGGGNQLTVNGSQNPSVGRGLLNFSPTSTTGVTIGTLNIPAGTTISEVDITFAVVPSVCSGANYAVQFDPGSGPINITQNTAFKFKYSSPITISGNAQSVTLLFGSIVNAMVAKGTGLNDSSIQTINVGQAQ